MCVIRQYPVTPQCGNNTMCVLLLFKCTRADKGKNNTMYVISLFKCTQADKDQSNTMCVLSLFKWTHSQCVLLLKCTQFKQIYVNTFRKCESGVHQLKLEFKLKKIKRGEPLDHFFHQILFSHWSEALTCDQILDSDWRRGATAQLIPPVRRIGPTSLRIILTYENLIDSSIF